MWDNDDSAILLSVTMVLEALLLVANTDDDIINKIDNPINIGCSITIILWPFNSFLS